MSEMVPGEYVLTYHSSRREVWRWYWRSWRKKYWHLHATIAALAGAVFITPSATLAHKLLQWGSGWLFMFPVVVFLFASWPQVKFKRSERWLAVGPSGWYTRIGAMTGSKSWREVAGVAWGEGCVLLVSVGGNALIVPARAFTDDAQMKQFARDAASWHKAARNLPPDDTVRGR